MPTELGQIKALLEEPRLLRSDTVEHVDAMAVVHVPGGHAPVGTPKDASPLGNRRGVNDFTLESPALQGLASALLARRKRELGRSDHGRRQVGGDDGLASPPVSALSRTRAHAPARRWPLTCFRSASSRRN